MNKMRILTKRQNLLKKNKPPNRNSEAENYNN